MSKSARHVFDRREILKTSAVAIGGTLLTGDSAYPKNVNTNSRPSKLKITDLRVATIVKPGPSPCPIIRIDTDQGVYGLGEVRDGASATYAKSVRIGRSSGRCKRDLCSFSKEPHCGRGSVTTRQDFP